MHLLDDWPMPALGLDCFVMEADSGVARARLVSQLAADPRIELAQPMQVFHALAEGDPLSAAQPIVTDWHLRELHALGTGRNVNVAVIDTGVDVGHPDLQGRRIVTRNFVDSGPFPAESHGTQVVGIIGARSDDGVGIAGVAPQARLLALRACWPSSTAASGAVCSSFTLAKALQFALDAHVQVLNLSLTGPRDPLLGRLLDAALGQRISVVAAVDTHSADGGFPSSHHDVIAVAGEQARDHPSTSLLAPDRGIPATTVGGGWSFVSGSSYAAAQVTGLVALLRGMAPATAPAQLRAALAPEVELGLAPRRPERIDACAAVVRVTQRCACDCIAGSTTHWRPRR
ncbi:S8 family serine peptidase [Lysobacter sp. LF1]|uniref:S8 family serine peptidase n=1 Tax=Lysobacter stagni TaxID=3045172 RepID=A0ABT6XE36_9GAMM|nr:S8 family serine peptidase [Lysobacter sp. LF1]MDI9238404.1 S8 family serine peptidase [Lysobacter sp. LF1]